jgi:predicted transcriptional regulator
LTLNEPQRFALAYLDSHGAKSAHDVAYEMTQAEVARNPIYGYRVGYDRAHESLKRLEKRGLVERNKVGASEARWSITGAGREALNK